MNSPRLLHYGFAILFVFVGLDQDVSRDVQENESSAQVWLEATALSSFPAQEATQGVTIVGSMRGIHANGRGDHAQPKPGPTIALRAERVSRHPEA